MSVLYNCYIGENQSLFYDIINAAILIINIHYYELLRAINYQMY